jgi:hypothetical protein
MRRNSQQHIKNDGKGLRCVHLYCIRKSVAVFTSAESVEDSDLESTDSWKIESARTSVRHLTQSRPQSISLSHLRTLPYTYKHKMPPSSHQRDISHTDTIESLSALLTQLYTLHILLPSHSASNSLSISQPPHSPSPSLLSTWQTAGMSDSVIQTLLQLPYLSGTGNKEIAPDTLALDYLDENGDAVEVWKDPFCLNPTPSSTGEGKGKQKVYLGNAIPLTSCIGYNGCLLLLDLDSSMSDFSSLAPSLTSSLFLYLFKSVKTAKVQMAETIYFFPKQITFTKSEMGSEINLTPTTTIPINHLSSLYNNTSTTPKSYIGHTIQTQQPGSNFLPITIGRIQEDTMH